MNLKGLLLLELQDVPARKESRDPRWLIPPLGQPFLNPKALVVLLDGNHDRSVHDHLTNMGPLRIRDDQRPTLTNSRDPALVQLSSVNIKS